ncbi:MAG: LLM class F420-dependent oxidoreductase [Actinomycetota bacterium]
MRLCLMIEGQEGVTWDQWLDLARTAEGAGLEGLFRSDHYVSVRGRTELGSLDAWTTLAGLAAHTTRLRLGTLVSPATFRHPSVLAKSVATVDHISGGRVELGMGAGWYELEHAAYGFEFPDTATRLGRLAEQLEIVHRTWTEDGLDFTGDHYRLSSLDGRPKPVQTPHPPIIVGGSGGARSVALAARWADEYNTLLAAPEECRSRKESLAAAWDKEGRDPETLRFSLMTSVLIGETDADLHRRAARLAEWRGRGEEPGEVLESMKERGVVGTADQAIEALGTLADAGIDRVMLQHLLHDDLDTVELIGKELVPAVS